MSIRSKRSAMIESVLFLNKPDFTDFKERNLDLTKKELIRATFARSSFTGLWVNKVSTTKQTSWETCQYLPETNKLLAYLETHWIARKVSSAVCPSSRQFYGWYAGHSYQYVEFWQSCQPLICHPTFLTKANPHWVHPLLAVTTYHCPNDWLMEPVKQLNRFSAFERLRIWESCFN